MYPAAESSMAGLVFISLVFGIVTVTTMLGVVLLATYGVNFVRLGKLERYSHALAGAIVLLSGIGILYLGL